MPGARAPTRGRGYDHRSRGYLPRVTRPSSSRGVLRRPPSERERIASEIADRLDGPITALGVIFLLVVVAQAFVEAGTAAATAFDLAAWALWLVFVVEFVARAVVAPSTARFLRRNWWQLAFLIVPFLRFVRILHAMRLARAGRIVSSAVRSSRTARHSLTSRLGWLMAATVIVILTSSQLLYEFSSFGSYPEALHRAALTVIAGEPLQRDDAFGKVVEVVLALYSVVVFATLAGSVGAYFLERRAAAPAPLEAASGATLGG